MKGESDYREPDPTKDPVEKFHVVEKQGEVVLVPVSCNPLEDLRDKFSDVDKSVKQMRSEVLEIAMDEAGI